MLLERSEPWLRDAEIPGLARNESDAQVLRVQGVNAVVCSGFEDEEGLQAVAEELDSDPYTLRNWAMGVVDGIGNWWWWIPAGLTATSYQIR